MTNNRRIALGIAIDDYFSASPTAEVFENSTLEELEAMQEEGHIAVWQPFEYYPMDDVCGYIACLADVIEMALNEKDNFYRVGE